MRDSQSSLNPGETLADYYSTQSSGTAAASGSNSPQWSQAALYSAFQSVTQKKGATVKTRGIIILGFLLLAAMAFGQTDNTLYVKNFPGKDVGTKIAAAQSQCGTNTAIPCILVLDPSLAVFPAGTFPTLCAQCKLADYRGGTPWTASGVTQVYVSPGTGTITAALAATPNFAVFNLACGTYIDNVVLNDVMNDYLIGQGPQCTFIQPQNTANPAVSITSTGAGGGSTWSGLRELQLQCPTNTVCGDGLLISGYTSASQGGGWLNFLNVTIFGNASSGTYGFNNNIHVTGGLLTANFRDIYSVGGRNAGVAFETSNPVNDVHFKSAIIQQTWGYGVKLATTSSPAPASIDFDDSVIQYDGYNTALTNCGGLYSNNSNTLHIHNSYFEGNCKSNAQIATAADIRLTGTYNQATSIRDNSFFQDWNEYGILNDTTQTTGVYSGNNFVPGANCIGVATSHAQSNVHIGANFNCSPTITADGNGNTHVSYDSPLALDYSTDGGGGGGISGNTLTLNYAQNSAVIWGGPWTLKNIVGGYAAGRLLYLYANSNPVTLSYSAGGAGQIVGPGGVASKILPVGDGVWLFADGANWHVMGETPARGVATLASGTVTVSHAAACTPGAACVYKLTECAKNSSTGTGTLQIGSVTAGTSFVINSMSASAAVLTTDLATVCWQIN